MPFITFHRTDQPGVILAAASGAVPVVVAETDTIPLLLLTPADLDECSDAIDRLVNAIESPPIGGAHMADR